MVDKGESGMTKVVTSADRFYKRRCKEIEAENEKLLGVIKEAADRENGYLAEIERLRAAVIDMATCNDPFEWEDETEALVSRLMMEGEDDD
jgi:hypothetical protein